MNENETQYQPIEIMPSSIIEEEKVQPDVPAEEPDIQSIEPDHDEDDNREGFTFNWIPLVIAVLAVISGQFVDWMFILFLSIVVIIHELGHVVIGKSFGCVIKKMQVFFFSFVSYKPKQIPGGSSWRNITWSLGVLPWGGFTEFKSRKTDEDDDIEMNSQDAYQDTESSPYIDDKPAWQQLLISAGGVLFNFITFLILFFVLSFAPSIVVYYLAAMSLLLAVLNILPIYPLDGGAILFAGYEIITGKKPSQKFTKVCGTIGFIVIILLFWIFPGWIEENIISKVFGAFFG